MARAVAVAIAVLAAMALSVAAQGPPQAVGNIPDILIEVTDTLSPPINVAPFFSDPEDEVLSYTVSQLPLGVSLSGSIISGTPFQVVTIDVVVTATDGSGGFDTQTFEFKVVPEGTLMEGEGNNGGGLDPVDCFDYPSGIDDTHPAYGAWPPNYDESVITNGEVDFQLELDTVTAFDFNVDFESNVCETVALTLTPAPPAGLSFSNGVLSGDPVSPGTTTHTLAGCDDGGCTNVMLVIRVNRSPTVVAAIPAMTFNLFAMGSVPISGAFSDPDGDSMLFIGSNLPDGLSVTVSGDVSGTPLVTGSFTATALVTDGHGGSVSSTFQVTVEDEIPNLAPVLVTPGPDPVIVFVDEPMAPFGVAAFFDDPEDAALTFASANLPAGLTLGLNSGTISGTPTSLGVTAVSVVATDDGFNTAVLTLSLTVRGPRQYSIVPALVTLGAEATVVSVVSSDLANGDVVRLAPSGTCVTAEQDVTIADDTFTFVVGVDVGTYEVCVRPVGEAVFIPGGSTFVVTGLGSLSPDWHVAGAPSTSVNLGGNGLATGDTIRLVESGDCSDEPNAFDAFEFSVGESRVAPVGIMNPGLYSVCMQATAAGGSGAPWVVQSVSFSVFGVAKLQPEIKSPAVAVQASAVDGLLGDGSTVRFSTDGCATGTSDLAVAGDGVDQLDIDLTTLGEYEVCYSPAGSDDWYSQEADFVVAGDCAHPRDGVVGSFVNGRCACDSGYASEYVGVCDNEASGACFLGDHLTIHPYVYGGRYTPNNAFELEVRHRIRQDRRVYDIAFGSDDDACGYPGASAWKRVTSATCEDRYLFELSSDLLATCVTHFVEVDAVPGQHGPRAAGVVAKTRDEVVPSRWRRYQVDITVSVAEEIEGLNGLPVYRTTSSVLTAYFFVPIQFVVHGTVSIADSFDFSNSMVVSSAWVYNEPPEPSYAEIRIQTLVPWPYRLGAVTAVEGTNDDVVISVVEADDGSAQTDPSCPVILNEPCTQELVVRLQPEVICSIDGDYFVDLAVDCRDAAVGVDGTGCVTAATRIELLNVQGSDLCSLLFVDETGDVEASMVTYSSNLYNAESDEFFLGQDVFFEVTVDSDTLPVEAVYLDYVVSYEASGGTPVRRAVDATLLPQPSRDRMRFSIYLSSAAFPVDNGEVLAFSITAAIRVDYNSLAPLPAAGSGLRNTGGRSSRRELREVLTTGLLPSSVIEVNWADESAVDNGDGGAGTLNDFTTGSSSGPSTGLIIGLFLIGIVVAVLVIMGVIISRRRSDRRRGGKKRRSGSSDLTLLTDRSSSRSRSRSRRSRRGSNSSGSASRRHSMVVDNEFSAYERRQHLSDVGEGFYRYDPSFYSPSYSASKSKGTDDGANYTVTTTSTGATATATSDGGGYTSTGYYSST